MSQGVAPVEDVSIVDEMHNSFTRYGTYVNYGRAFPNAADGLKPSQRRILVAMHMMGARPGKPRVKSARAASETTGKYHPHGSTAVYGTMVGLAQPFNKVLPLIDGQGNWGSLGFGAAADRYTECRLATSASALLGILPGSDSLIPEMDEGTVDMVDNYSGEFREPLILPALWPSLVVNPDEGMGLGKAFTTAGHNLDEVMDLAIHMVDYPEVRWSTIKAKLPGPDMPSDCDIFDGDNEGHDIESYMTTGQGSFVMRARWEIEEYQINRTKKGHRIVVVGLPYKTSSEEIVYGISDMIGREYLPETITTINATSSKGVRVVIDIGELDTDDVIQRCLYHSRTSKFQETFTVNLRAIVGDELKALGIIDALRHWIRHRKIVVQRRSQFRLEKAVARMHLIDGFIKAVPLARDIVELVQGSDDRNHARQRMMERWGFSEIQATAILDMSIGQITKLGVEKFENEKVEVQALIDECNLLLTSDDALRAQLKKEMRQVKKHFGTPRRCNLIEGSAKVDRPETPAVEEPVYNGILVRTAKNWLRWVQKSSISKVTDSDIVVEMDSLTTGNAIEMVTDLGYHCRVSATDIPKNLTNSKAVFGSFLYATEDVVMVGSGANRGDVTDIVMVTKNGKIKRIPEDSWVTHGFRKAYLCIGMDDDDKVMSSFFLDDSRQDIIIMTAYGRALKIDSDQIAAKGDKAKALPVIRLQAEDDKVIFAGTIDRKAESEHLMYWTSGDRIGAAKVSTIRYGNRGTQGQALVNSENYVVGSDTIPSLDGEVSWFDGDLNTEKVDIPVGFGLGDRDLVKSSGQLNASVWVGFNETE